MREKLIELLNQSFDKQYCRSGLLTATHTADFLIANDVVPVIRCMDCKHWKPGESMMGNSLDDMQRVGRCEYVRFRRLENDFCSYGERKDNG
jgi:hypothetical protein